MHMQQVDQRHLGSLQRHWKRHRAFPSMAKLADIMGLASAGSVFQAVGRLVEGGYLERVEGRIAPTRRFFSRPLLGQVRAGLPDQAYQAGEPELLSADEYLVRQPDRTSFAFVKGESMRDIGLMHGDVVAVEHNTPPKPGDIVVAVVDGATTVKRLVLERGHYVLEAANPAFETIRPGASLEVLGVVVGSFRRMTT
jgi:repressor LexA